jgi:hypothetical protein
MWLRSNHLIVLCCIAGSSPWLVAADWITAPSTFTHDPQTGERVNQFSPIGPVYVYTPPDYVKSGYRHLRSTIQVGGSADNYHLVEEWGRPVVPYDQWRFPARPYGSPYSEWGAPLAGGNFYNGYPGFGYGGGYGFGGNGNVNPYTRNAPAQYLDGHWPTYDRNDRSDYYRPYR